MRVEAAAVSRMAESVCSNLKSEALSLFGMNRILVSEKCITRSKAALQLLVVPEYKTMCRQDSGLVREAT